LEKNHYYQGEKQGKEGYRSFGTGKEKKKKRDQRKTSRSRRTPGSGQR
jgi:hypothetical protein